VEWLAWGVRKRSKRTIAPDWAVSFDFTAVAVAHPLHRQHPGLAAVEATGP
jgi:hypothetical protein